MCVHEAVFDIVFAQKCLEIISKIFAEKCFKKVLHLFWVTLGFAKSPELFKECRRFVFVQPSIFLQRFGI